MSNVVPKINDCYPIIYRVSTYTRYIVHLETAYDIIDEISRSNSDQIKVLDGFQKLSRLATKVVNDLNKEDFLDKANNNEKEIINKIINQLINWSSDYEKFIECLRNSDMKDFAKYIKTYATLSISPDYYSLTLKDIKER